MLKKFLLSKNVDAGLFVIRVSIGLLMLFSHGLGKLTAFADKYHSFPDPLSVGSETSYILTVGAEFFCSALLIIGLCTRVAVIPLIINMLVIVLVIQNHEVWNKKEFGVLFLIPYLAIFLAGPGKYSLDYMLLGKNNSGKG